MINKRDVNKLVELHKELCDPEVYSYRKRIPDDVNEMVKLVNKHFNCHIKVEDVLTANGLYKKKLFGKYEYSIFMVTRRFFYYCNHAISERDYPAIPIDKIATAKAENGFLIVTNDKGKKREVLVKKPEYYVAFFDALLKVRDDAFAAEEAKNPLEKLREMNSNPTVQRANASARQVAVVKRAEAPVKKETPKKAELAKKAEPIKETPKKEESVKKAEPVKETPKKEEPADFSPEVKEKFDKALDCYKRGYVGEAHVLFNELLPKHHPGAAFYMAQMLSERIVESSKEFFSTCYILYSQVLAWGPDSEWALKASALRTRYKILSLVPPDLVDDKDPVEELYSCAEKDYRYYMNIVEYTYAGFIPHESFFEMTDCYDGYYEGCKDLVKTIKEILRVVSIAEALNYFMFLMDKTRCGDFDQAELDKVSDELSIFSKDSFTHKVVRFDSFKSDEIAIFKNEDGTTFEHPVKDVDMKADYLDPVDEFNYYDWNGAIPIIFVSLDDIDLDIDDDDFV